ncbi:hypothetical protein AVEN_26327-1 [Araneus ventricosus]|uniref:Uncharacterized protein n=1 Tax=Araneus ventricosus TaxID=182803 RepID=A0A4Y2ANR7_ARAVE|nr:hypothetical protein AVEN_26327-1 [Araneus ventricosus]
MENLVCLGGTRAQFDDGANQKKRFLLKKSIEQFSVPSQIRHCTLFGGWNPGFYTQLFDPMTYYSFHALLDCYPFKSSPFLPLSVTFVPSTDGGA